MTRTDDTDARDLERLRSAIAARRRVVVAFSGGTDSTLVASIAAEVLGSGAVAVTARSPSLAARERERAAALAARLGLRHREIDTEEMRRDAYRANVGDRCYHCKSELFERLEAVRVEEGCEVILDGTNLADLGDTRPGLRAAREWRVASPLVEAGLDKAAVRRLSRRLGLPTWDLPDNACLASRLPVGTEVSVARLRRVEVAEEGLHRLGLRLVRVRDAGRRGRIELGAAELRTVAQTPGLAARVEAAVEAAGFESAWIDPAGYRQGGADRRQVAASPGPDRGRGEGDG
ncbi:MAG: ATP-dependent sacrificial sulfur transferase LarE [Candidatus Eiseniibacteriota bacterium]|jgi:uncharacterized protein